MPRRDDPRGTDLIMHSPGRDAWETLNIRTRHLASRPLRGKPLLGMMTTMRYGFIVPRPGDDDRRSPQNLLCVARPSGDFAPSSVRSSSRSSGVVILRLRGSPSTTTTGTPIRSTTEASSVTPSRFPFA
jgi:hypothetical protein